jgi:hypothetical protein
VKLNAPLFLAINTAPFVGLYCRGRVISRPGDRPRNVSRGTVRPDNLGPTGVSEVCHRGDLEAGGAVSEQDATDNAVAARQPNSYLIERFIVKTLGRSDRPHSDQQRGKPGSPEESEPIAGSGYFLQHKPSTSGDIVGSHIVGVADDGVHDRIDHLTVLIWVVESDEMPEFVNSDSPEIHYLVALEGSPVGIPRNAWVKIRVSFDIALVLGL